MSGGVQTVDKKDLLAKLARSSLLIVFNFLRYIYKQVAVSLLVQMGRFERGGKEQFLLQYV
jgi:hypothetical protein